MRAAPKILSDVSKSVSSGGVQFLITLLTTPLMTRLYQPEAYATFGIINTMATTTVGLGLLSLPNAYPLEKEAFHREEILRTMARLLSMLVLIALIAATAMAATNLLQVSPIALIFLPILVFTFGLRQILISITTSRADFSTTSLAQIVEPTCSRGSSVALGVLAGSHPAFILFAVAAGHLSTAALIIKRVLKGSIHPLRTLFSPGRSPLAIIRQHFDFAFFNTLSQQAQPLVALGLQLSIASFFTHETAGHYILAVSILSLPVSLIAMTSGSVMYRHFIEIVHTNPTRLASDLKRSIMLYLGGGILVMAPLFFFGETLFAIAFGKNWTHAGHIASILSVAYVSGFILTGAQSIFRVTRTLRLHFKLETISCALMFSFAAVCFNTFAFDTAMICLSALWLLRNGMMLAACLFVATRYSRNAP